MTISRANELILYLVALFAFILLSGCAARSGEIAVLDTYVLHPSEYDGAYSNSENEDRLDNRYTVICRSRDEYLAECPKVGIDPGYGVPDYSDEWFKEQSVILLALFEAGAPPEQTVTVEKVISESKTAMVYMRYTHVWVNLISCSYSVVIEVDAKSVKNIETVELQDISYPES